MNWKKINLKKTVHSFVIYKHVFTHSKYALILLLVIMNTNNTVTKYSVMCFLQEGHFINTTGIFEVPFCCWPFYHQVILRHSYN